MSSRTASSWSLAGKVVLITGAGGGIGSATAIELAARGATLVLADLDALALTDVQGRIATETSTAVLDVTDANACAKVVQDAIDRHGRIDVVWANAGISAYGPMDLVESSTWLKVVEVNLLGAYNIVRAALPQIIEQRGYIATTCSIASFAHQPGHTAYAASKSGLEAMTNSLRSELAGTGVSVGTFHPGWIATKMVTEKDDHQLAFQRFRAALKPPFKSSVPAEQIAPHLAEAFERRTQRLVYPRAGWLAHALRPVLNTELFAGAVRAAAPEIRSLYKVQADLEGAGAAMSARYRAQVDDTVVSEARASGG